MTTEDRPTVSVETPYGTLAAHVWAGPSLVPGTIHANDGKHPTSGHAFGREADAPYVGATVETAGDATLTINGVAYTVMARFLLDSKEYGMAAGWAEDRSGYGYHLKRAGGGYFSDPVTDGARKAWYSVIVPAVIAALTDAPGAIAEAEAIGRRKFRVSVTERADALRAEADRLVGLVSSDPRYFQD